jgi:hypothetical protein
MDICKDLLRELENLIEILDKPYSSIAMTPPNMTGTGSIHYTITEVDITEAKRIIARAKEQQVAD